MVVKRRFFGKIADQMKAFNTGFRELVSASLIKVFDENELEVRSKHESPPDAKYQKIAL